MIQEPYFSKEKVLRNENGDVIDNVKSKGFVANESLETYECTILVPTG